MHEFFLSNPYSGMILTIGCYGIGQYIFNKTKLTILQPILLGSVLIIIFLNVTGIKYEEYYEQNAILNYLLPMTAVVLAVPLYRNLHILKKHALPIIAGVISGTVATMGSMVIIGKLIGTDDKILLTMLPKNATNPIAIEVSKIIEGIPSLTVALVVIAGLIGAVFGPELLDLMKIKNKIARGIAIGSMSHAVGTARAFKEGELEGSMSSLAMAITGTLVAIVSPIFALLIL
ncbi:LrgB family protein [Anaerovorax odorimutans]|uniref:LrgB family protein n=1 Tax=Anaerovorax odorimutans TaxID=109327 RepID=UPI000401D8F8|nr:LrgB family protein [Anaerovorax odorimutans]